MATIKIETVAGGTTYTVTKTVSAAHLTRFIAAMRVVLDRPSPQFTDAQVHAAWAQRIYDQARADTKRVEAQAATTAAAAGVTEIDIT